MHRHAIGASVLKPIPADAQGDVHLVQSQDLAMGYGHPVTYACRLGALTTKHPAFEALDIGKRGKYVAGIYHFQDGLGFFSSLKLTDHRSAIVTNIHYDTIHKHEMSFKAVDPNAIGSTCSDL